MPIADVEATHTISGFVYACLGGYSAGQKVFFKGVAYFKEADNKMPKLYVKKSIEVNFNNQCEL